MESSANIGSKDDYFGVDLGRMIMALAVVLIHINFISIESRYFILRLIASFVDFAVPFFFIASGFFLERKVTVNRTRINVILLDFLKKNITIYLIWTLLYLPLTIYGLYTEGNLNIHGVAIFLRNLLVKGENFYSWPLWYLLSVIYVAAWFSVWHKLKLSKRFLIISGLTIYLLDAFLLDPLIVYIDNNAITWFYESTLESSRILSGFLFISIGVCLYSYFSKIDFKIGILGFISGLLLNMLNLPILQILGLIIGSICLFSVLLDIQYSNGKIGFYMRKFSSVTFFSHMYFFFFLRYLSEVPAVLQSYEFIVTIIMCILLTFVVLRTQHLCRLFRVIY